MMMRHAMPSVRLLSSLSGGAPARQLGPLLLLLLSGLNFDNLHCSTYAQAIVISTVGTICHSNSTQRVLLQAPGRWTVCTCGGSGAVRLRLFSKLAPITYWVHRRTVVALASSKTQLAA
eukprot:COSAG01_NODE_28951_length_648_cov_8.734062_1_plen_118_part_01